MKAMTFNEVGKEKEDRGKPFYPELAEGEYRGFDLRTTGDGFYDRFIHEGASLLDDLGVASYIAEMTPDDYIRAISQCVLNSDIEEQREKMKEPRDAGKIDKLAELISQGVKLKLPWLDTALRTQDGRHRALAAKKLGIPVIPVLYIYDPEAPLSIRKSKTFNEVLIDDIMKFNPYHDSLGRFASGYGMGHFAPTKGKTPNGQRLLDMYRATHMPREDEKENPKEEKPKQTPGKEKPTALSYREAAKTTQEAEQMLVDAGIAKKVNFSGCRDMDAVNEAKDALVMMKDRYGGDTLDEIDFSGDQRGKWGSYATTINSRTGEVLNRKISISNKLMNDRNAIDKETEKVRQRVEVENEKFRTAAKMGRISQAKADAAIANNNEVLKYVNGFTVNYPGKSIACTVIHEYAHALTIPKMTDKYGLQSDAGRMATSTLRKAKNTGDIFKISKYGSSNSKEFVAEATVVRELGNGQLPGYINQMLTTLLGG